MSLCSQLVSAHSTEKLRQGGDPRLLHHTHSGHGMPRRYTHPDCIPMHTDRPWMLVQNIVPEESMHHNAADIAAPPQYETATSIFQSLCAPQRHDGTLF